MAPPLTLAYIGFKSPHNPYNLSSEAIGAIVGSYIYPAPDRPRVLLPSNSPNYALLAALRKKGLVEDSGYHYDSGYSRCDDASIWKLTPLGIEEYERLLEMHLQEDEL